MISQLTFTVLVYVFAAVTAQMIRKFTSWTELLLRLKRLILLLFPLPLLFIVLNLSEREYCELFVISEIYSRVQFLCFFVSNFLC